MRFFILGLLIFGISFVAHGQSKTSDKNISINVSAQIISSIELTTIQSMRLSKADAMNNRIEINPQDNSNAGKMIASGTPNSDIRVSYISKRELNHPENLKSLEFNYWVAINDQDDQSSAELLDQENHDFKFNSNGNLYIWIGGAVDITNASPGQYEGEFTLDIEYI